jgi:dolichol-phosphate mannosyltransferase
MRSVALVMPAYNEADGIAEFLTEIDELLPEVTVFVVDDCSTDMTSKVVESLSLPRVDLRLVRNDRNVGHGPTTLQALEMGLASGAEVVIAVDGDGQVLAEDIRRLLDTINAGAAGVVEAVRVNRRESAYRRLTSLATRVITRIRARDTVPDANTPFRAYRRNVLERLIGVVPAESMVPNLWISVVSRRLGLVIQTIEVPSRPRRGTTTEGSTWGVSRINLPTRRFMRFCVVALVEWFVQWPNVRRSLRRTS